MLVVSRQDWLQRYDKPKTKKQASIALTAFDKFLASNNYNENNLLAELRSSQDDTRYLLLQKLVSYWNGFLSPTSIGNYFVFVRNYLRYQGIKTDKDEIKDLIKFPKILREIREPMTADIIKTLLKNSNKKFSSFILVQASSGMRLGETLQLQKNDVDLNSDPVTIKLSPVITKMAGGRETYISRQAAETLPDNLFMDYDKAACEQYMIDLRKRCGLLSKYSNGKNYHVNIHSLRSFFITQATLKHGGDYAHALAGHGSYLGQYFRIPKETRSKMYKELEPSVTFD